MLASNKECVRNTNRKSCFQKITRMWALLHLVVFRKKLFYCCVLQASSPGNFVGRCEVPCCWLVLVRSSFFGVLQNREQINLSIQISVRFLWVCFLQDRVIKDDLEYSFPNQCCSAQLQHLLVHCTALCLILVDVIQNKNATYDLE